MTHDLPAAPGNSEWEVNELPAGPRTLRMQDVPFPEVLAAHASGDPSPWWAHVWPAGLELAEFVLRGPRLDGLRCMDLGCGSGIVGVALGLAGAEVTFADSAPRALGLAQHNAKLNGLERFDVELLDWDNPSPKRYDRVYASDVLYEASQLVPFVASLGLLLAPGGVAYLADPKRQPLRRLFGLLADARFDVHTEREREDFLLLRIARTWE